MSIVRFFSKPDKIMLINDTVSRWIIPSSTNYIKKTNLICDRANEDHCGSCGDGLLLNNPDINYFITTEQFKTNKTFSNLVLNNIFNDSEKYYFPYTI